MRLTKFKIEFRPGSKVNPGGRPSGINRGVRANFWCEAEWEDGVRTGGGEFRSNGGCERRGSWRGEQGRRGRCNLRKVR